MCSLSSGFSCLEIFVMETALRGIADSLLFSNFRLERNKLFLVLLQRLIFHFSSSQLSSLHAANF